MGHLSEPMSPVAGLSLPGNRQSYFLQTLGPWGGLGRWEGRVCRKQKDRWWLPCEAASLCAASHTHPRRAPGHSGLPESLCLRPAPSSSRVHFMARNRLVPGDPLPAVCGLHPLPFPLEKVAPEGQGWDRGGGDQTLLLILLSQGRVSSCVFHPTDSLMPSGGLQTRLDT